MDIKEIYNKLYERYKVGYKEIYVEDFDEEQIFYQAEELLNHVIENARKIIKRGEFNEELIEKRNSESINLEENKNIIEEKINTDELKADSTEMSINVEESYSTDSYSDDSALNMNEIENLEEFEDSKKFLEKLDEVCSKDEEISEEVVSDDYK